MCGKGLKDVVTGSCCTTTASLATYVAAAQLLLVPSGLFAAVYWTVHYTLDSSSLALGLGESS